MRADALPPRLWLLGAVAAWAVCVWLLALFGLGGNLRPLPDDASLRRPLPQLGKLPPERLGPASQYGSLAARPLFSQDRKPQPFVINPGNEDDKQDDTFDYVLTSVLITPQLRMAIVEPSAGGDPVRFKLDQGADQVPGWTLTALEPRGATFTGPQGERSLQLRVFDGSPAPPSKKGGRDAAPDAAEAAADAANAADAADAVSRPPPAEAAAADDAGSKPPPPAQAEAQLEAIRKRIEERRARMRRNQNRPAAPAQNP